MLEDRLVMPRNKYKMEMMVNNVEGVKDVELKGMIKTNITMR